MTVVAAIGDERVLAGYALAGVLVLGGEPQAAWKSLPDETALLLLTPAAADTLAGVLAERPSLLAAVLP